MASGVRFVDAAEQAALRAFNQIRDGNPFSPERVEWERAALGSAFVAHGSVWHVAATSGGANPNVPRLAERAESLARELRGRLAAGAVGTPDQLRSYEGLVHYVLFERYAEDVLVLAEAVDAGKSRSVSFYEPYRRDFDHYLRIANVSLPLTHPAPVMLALGYQVRRAFHHIYRAIYGGAPAAARLRAAVWESVFTRDVQRYRRVLFERMADIPTLIVGESGTGKELVARAIGLSQYIPFDERRKRFVAEAARLFQPVNLSALSASLIESELFGHRRGAFTGAVEDRAGWLESCPPFGSIFLDEIGEFDAALQVKLLRVLQDRSFQRIGEVEQRRFSGKILAATNRDLALEMDRGSFRRDLYYRLCADVIHTPGLAAQIEESPEELRNLIQILARRIVGDAEADPLTEETLRCIERHLGPRYPWPGNVRELEQCLRNVLVRGEYWPAEDTSSRAVGLADRVVRGELTAEELLREYCTLVYRQAGSYEGAARRLALDRRTVRARVQSSG